MSRMRRTLPVKVAGCLSALAAFAGMSVQPVAAMPEQAVGSGNYREMHGHWTMGPMVAPARLTRPRRRFHPGELSLRGREAIGYAFQQLGKPYEWGAQGPEAYDCSGLTTQAWRHAGVAIPRTSQEQWRRLHKVPLSGLRPGDLVVYFAHATHVAIYIGNGKVIQAPHRGAFVKVSPIAANPILGAVRPGPWTAS